jgi:hypothetical protein
MKRKEFERMFNIIYRLILMGKLIGLRPISVYRE